MDKTNDDLFGQFVENIDRYLPPFTKMYTNEQIAKLLGNLPYENEDMLQATATPIIVPRPVDLYFQGRIPKNIYTEEINTSWSCSFGGLG